ncbi:MAG: ATP-dependent zinc metalloprotease FtsH [Bacillota bacterium]|nr:ATP-dependent zinc metalloprotease FtsH [Bacillota bacterium]
MAIKRPPLRGLSFYIVVLVIIVLFATFFSPRQNSGQVPLSQAMTFIEEGKVQEVQVTGSTVRMVLRENEPNVGRVIELPISPMWLEDLQKRLDTAGVVYTYRDPVDVGAWINIIMLVLMFGSMAFFIWMMYSRQSGEGRNAMNFGRSRARVHDPSKNPVTFADVAGADEEKHELQEVVDFLKNPRKYSDLGARIPRGILLVGPPGTGKTLLAKAVAGEAGVPFYSISGSDFVEMFVGVGASRVRDLFETAKKNAPSIVFIDEIDAVGRHRGAGMGGGHDEREQTLNQLLVEMDGFGPNQDVIIMAATNRPDILDPALLRPGRFDRRVTVMRPDINGRAAILQVHSKGKPLGPDVDLLEIARLTPGFTGADLANLLNEAALGAARRGARQIRYNDVSEAVFKIMIGPEKKSRVVNEKDRRSTAYHEAGHAIVLRTVSETDRVERVSIIPAGAAGGYTAFKPNEDFWYATKAQLEAKIAIDLGGRAAEQLIFDEISTGAAADLQSCNSIARDMVVKYGMSEKLKNLVFSSDSEVFLGRDFGHVRDYSDELAGIIDAEVKGILDNAYARVMHILETKREALTALAEALLEHERVDGEEFERMYLEHTTPEQRADDAVLLTPVHERAADLPQPATEAQEPNQAPALPDAGSDVRPQPS